MKAKVNIQLYPDKIKTLFNAIEPSLLQATEAVKTQIASDQVVPKNVGELERSAFVRKKARSKYQIVYDTPYARRLYWHPEYDFRKDKNPHAQGLWMQSYVDGNDKNYFANAFKARLIENAKGLIT